MSHVIIAAYNPEHPSGGYIGRHMHVSTRSRWFDGWMLLLVSIVLVSCGQQIAPNLPLAPFVSAPDLLIDATTFPSGWVTNECEPNCGSMQKDFQAARRFSVPNKVGAVVQNVYAYNSAEQAQNEYSRYRTAQFDAPDRQPSTDFTVPANSYRSAVADEQYLACVMDIGAWCRFVARYRQYLVFIECSMESWQGYGEDILDDGLTLAELERVLAAQDTLIVETLGLKTQP